MTKPKTVREPAAYVSLKVAAERAEIGVNKRTSYNLSPLILETYPGFNGRPINRERVDLFKALKREGAVFPETVVWVEDGHTYILAGHHRNVADRELIAEGMPILVTPCSEFKGSDADRILFMCGENDGNPLTPLELGIQYKKLIDVCGWTVAKVAAKRARTVQHVADMMLLANSNSDVQGMVTRGEVSGTAALKTIKSHRGKAGKALAAGVAIAKAAGKTHATQKDIPKIPVSKLGVSYVAEVKENARVTKKHLAAMLDSPGLPADVQDAVRAVMKHTGAQIPETVTRTPLETRKFWLQELINAPETVAHVREAAKFFYAHLTLIKGNLAPVQPTILSLPEAIEAERLGCGSVMAETLCPEHAELIVYLRTAGARS